MIDEAIKIKPSTKKVIIGLISHSDISVDRLRHEINHIFCALTWLYKLNSKPSLALELATALHDCDRLFDKRRAHRKNFKNYIDYKKSHSKISAKIAGEILIAVGQKYLVNQVKDLIIAHEFGGTVLANKLKVCDSFAFFDQNLLDYYRDEGNRVTLEKMEFMYQRLDIKSKKLLSASALDFRLVPTLNNYFLKIKNQ
ncbi:MAG: hypothetical protein WCX08_02535 [Candidatus Buchananbacteria bacterium]|jgi:hypothetical protein